MSRYPKYPQLTRHRRGGILRILRIARAARASNANRGDAVVPPMGFGLDTGPPKSADRDCRVPVFRLSAPLVERLPAYHQIATKHGEEGNLAISSSAMAGPLGIDPTLVRKDMAALGVHGKPKIGYSIGTLISRLDRVLGFTDRKSAILIGCGHLGCALARYTGFSRYGLQISGLFDADPTKIGQTVAEMAVQPMEMCAKYIEIFGIEVAILTVPASCAQDLANWLVAYGIRAIWNFAPLHLKVQPDVVVRNENLALGLAQFLHEIKQPKPPSTLDPAPDTMDKSESAGEMKGAYT